VSSKYEVIYADPPWQYGDKALNRGGAERHYRTTDNATLADMNIPVADNAALFMWVTMPQLPAGLELMKKWGFTFKTVAFVWIKANKKATDTPFWGMGHWTRANAELVLMGVKGKPKRQSAGVHQLIVEPEYLDSQVIVEPIAQHSRKPDIVREKILELMGDVPRLEMFAREQAEGWDAFGDQAPKGILLKKKKAAPVKKKSLPSP